MKVILLRDVPKVGQRYEVKEVAPGYGRNFIIARGFGLAVTAANLKQVESLKAGATAERQVREELLLKSVADLEKVSIEIKAKANPEGHLFASIHAKQIVEA